MIVKRTLHYCWWTVAVVTVTLAVALSGARLLLPGMSDYRAQVESVAASFFKRPVKIGSLDAAWHAFSPVLKLNDVVVEDPRLPGGRLAIAEVEVALNVVDSLVHGKWRTAGFKVIGTTLELNTDILNAPREFPLQQVLDWLIPQESIAIEEVELVWEDPGLFEVPLRLSALSAQLVNEGARHQLLVEASLPMSFGDSFQIAADLKGYGSNISRWKGSLYVNTRDFQLSVLRPLLQNSGLIADGAANLELWVGIVDKKPVWGSGRIDLQKPKIENATADAQGISADNLAAGFNWQERKNKWRIGISDFSMQRDDEEIWPASSFNLALALDDGVRLQGHASLLVLDEFNGLLPLIPWVDDNALAMLDRLQPSGWMQEAEFQLSYSSDKEPEFAMRAAIENLTLAANSGMPGIKDVSGHIEGNLQAGFLRLETSRAEVVLPRIFPEPVNLSAVSGAVRWERFKNMFRIESEQLRVESGPLILDSRMQIDWFYDQAAPWVDLQMAAQSLPLNQVGAYLPVGVMPQKAVNWLQTAFKSGVAENTRVLLQGRLDQMPFDSHQGIFEARFDFSDVVLDYHPTWGQLDELNGYAVFSGRSMQIVGRTARILDSPVERVVAVIDDLQKPVLRIDGTVAGTFAGMLEYVLYSPLKQRFGALIESVEATGDARLQLDLRIPLKKHLGRIKLAGEVTLADNDLMPKDSDIGLMDIKGKLYFNRDGISVDKARARVLGEPVSLSVYKQGESGATETVIDMQGKLRLTDLVRKNQQSLAAYFDGQAHWQALLHISNQPKNGDARVSLELLSDLKGVSVSLPQPLAKPAGEARPIRIVWVPGREAEYPFDISYGKQTSARILLTANRRLRKAGVHFGAEKAQLPPQDMIHFTGRVSEFDLSRWLPVFKNMGGDGGRKAAPAIDLGSDVFRFANAELENMEVSSKHTDPWHFTVSGDGASGWVRWVPAERSFPSRLLAKLDKLKVTGGAEKVDDKPASPDKLRPYDLPELNIEIGQLRWGTRNLGQVNLASRRTREGTRFETLRINSPAIVLQASGDWQEHDESQFSRFNGQISDGDLGQLSALLGSGGSVTGSKLKGSVQLSWPGTPMDLSVAGVEGEFDLEARDGRLENVEEGAGKLLSLFSLNSLQRRLNLDFRDVVKEGFSFDSMSGHFVVMDGDAFTNNFSIQGTSVTIDIAGRTGLVDRDYDQLVTVTPQVTSTLPIAGAIAGGPAVGAAVFLADKLIGDQFNRLTRVQYQVTGGWDDPVYTRLKRESPKEPDDQSLSEDS